MAGRTLNVRGSNYNEQIRIPTFTEDQVHLLDIVYAGFMQAGEWPTTAFVDWRLDSEFGLDIDAVLSKMPVGAVVASGGYNDHSTATPSIAALRSVAAAAQDLQRMVDVIRFAAKREQTSTLGPRDPSEVEVNSTEANAIFGESPTPEDLVRLLGLLRLDSTNAGSAGPDPEGKWSIRFNSWVRPYRGVRDIDDYLARRPDPPQPAWVPPPPMEPYVFVLMPFGATWSENVKGVIGQVCDRAAGHFAGLRSERADDITETGRITDQIIAAIQRADVVIADITGSNPNVLFELGYADALGKRIIVLNQRVEQTPFDIKDWRQIPYSNENLPPLDKSLGDFLVGALRAQGYSPTS